MSLNPNSFSFDFNFSVGQHHTTLFCKGIPYTCGLYFISLEKGYEGMFACSSYIFKAGYGTASEITPLIHYKNEKDARRYLISMAIPRILALHYEMPQKVAAGWVC